MNDAHKRQIARWMRFRENAINAASDLMSDNPERQERGRAYWTDLINQPEVVLSEQDQ